MPRSKVIGWSLIASGMIAWFYFLLAVPNRDRFYSVQFGFTVFLFFALGIFFVGFPIVRQYFASGERTEKQVDAERWGCAGLIVLAMGLATLILFQVVS